MYGAKAFVDTNYTVVTMTFFTGLLVSWLVVRLVIFPTQIIYSAWMESDLAVKTYAEIGQSFPGLYLFNFLLCLLLCLHFYWYGLFLQMGMYFVNKGKTEDWVEKIEDADGKGAKKKGKVATTKRSKKEH